MSYVGSSKEVSNSLVQVEGQVGNPRCLGRRCAAGRHIAQHESERPCGLPPSVPPQGGWLHNKHDSFAERNKEK
jgi:hypothetical protein